MMIDIPHLRLSAQGFNEPAVEPGSPGSHAAPVRALTRLLAVQGQDYPGGKWTIGLRCPGCTDADLEQAIARREIVRTWALRGTLHFVAAADLRWLIALVGPGQIAGNARRYRELELDEETLHRSAGLLAGALAGSKSLDRPALFQILQEHGISTLGQRGVYMLQYASLTGLICQGAAVRNQPTFYLIGEALPDTAPKDDDEALAELALRYFTTRGPAALPDFMWWSGLPAARARRALDAARPHLLEETREGRVYWRSPQTAPATKPSPYVLLLPGFDEYLLSYKNRAEVMDVAAIRGMTPKNGMPPATIVVNGRVTGVWKRTLKKDRVSIAVSSFRELSSVERHSLQAAARHFGEYLGKTPELEWD